MPINLLIADDHPVIRVGLQRLLADTDIAIVAMAEDGLQALDLAHRHQPTVVLLDQKLPKLSGLQALARLRQELPKVQVLLFTAFHNMGWMAEAMNLGAVGYLLKGISREDLLAAIRSAAAGQSIWSSADIRRITGASLRPDLNQSDETPITPRELEVLKWLAKGLTNKEIAKEMSLSVETVKEHVQHLLQKLWLSDRTQAAVWAVRQGISPNSSTQ